MSGAIPGASRLIPFDKLPLGGSLGVGLVASLCCGGGLLFGAVGLGAFYGALGVARYIPEALASGAILIALVNWLYYRRRAMRPVACSTDCSCAVLRRAMVLNSFIGLVMMAGSFTLLEWLNHTVVNAHHSHEYAGALISGVPNAHLAYLAAAFLVLPLLAVLPFPHQTQQTTRGQTAPAS